jgi:hypothetical protein
MQIDGNEAVPKKSNWKGIVVLVGIIISSLGGGYLLGDLLTTTEDRYDLGLETGYNTGFDEGLLEGYPEGFSDGIDNATPNRALFNITAGSDGNATWFYNETGGVQNSTYEIIAWNIMLIKLSEIYGMIDLIQSVADWFYNESGESWFENETSNNFPSFEFAPSMNEMLNYRIVKNESSGEFDPLNLVFYEEQVVPYIIFNIGIEITNDSADYWFDPTGGNPKSITFAIDNDLIFGPLIQRVMWSMGIENETLGDWIVNNTLATMINYGDKLGLNLEDESNDIIEFNDYIVDQNEDFYDGSQNQLDYVSYLNFMKNGIEYNYYTNMSVIAV